MITSDWHIHSRNSCDDACMTLADMARGAAAKGILAFGVSDHIHTAFNLPDLAASRSEFEQFSPTPDFHFGVEVSCVSQWEIDEIACGRSLAKPPVYGLRSGGPPGAALAIGLTVEDLRRHKVEYVIGGAHWPMYVPIEREALIRDYHRQNMFLAAHPLVDIVAHPWWWHGHWKDADDRFTTEPWLADFGRIPRSLHDEFASSAIQHGALVEINAGAMLLTRRYPEAFKRRYLDYLAYLKERGVRLCFGSDWHSAQYDVDIVRASEMLDSVGITDADMWRLPPGHAIRDSGRGKALAFTPARTAPPKTAPAGTTHA
ncbi:MAG TPA: PHP domain-containing protein [Candidatus Brocadiia bacterium]|nr:PHP domain-containing protein [Candidatus Brocadiia bacterium]